MDKKELISFLKDSLRIELYKEELYNGGAQVEIFLNLVVDGEEIEIDSDIISIN